VIEWYRKRNASWWCCRQPAKCLSVSPGLSHSSRPLQGFPLDIPAWPAWRVEATRLRRSRFL